MKKLNYNVYLTSDAMVNLKHSGFKRHTGDFWIKKMNIFELDEFLKRNLCHIDIDQNIVDNAEEFGTWGIISENN